MREIKIKVRCIEKPQRDKYTSVDVTVGNIYAVLWVDADDLKIIDDKGAERFYRARLFEDVPFESHVSNKQP